MAEIYDNFVHLHVHTSIGSMQDAMTNVDDLFKKASKLGQNSLAITDHGTMAAVFDARKASKKYGVKYIPGIEAYFVDDVKLKPEKNNPKTKRRHIVLLAKNEIGYKNLLRLNWEGYKSSQYIAIINKIFPRIDWDMLEKYNEGIICLTACGSGLVSRQMFIHNDDGEWIHDTCNANVFETITKLKNIFKDDLYLEIQPHSLKVYSRNRKTGDLILNKHDEKIVVIDQDHINRQLIEMSRKLNIKNVATADIHYLEKEDAKIHDMLMAISSKAPLSDKTRHRYEVEEFYMKSSGDIINHFTKFENRKFALKLCDNSVEIANKCIDSEYLDTFETRFPKFDLQSQKDYNDFLKWNSKQKIQANQEDHAFMRYRCIKAFKQKYKHLKGDNRKKYIKRMMNEIEVFELRNFCSYMLIVSDFIIAAKNHGIPVGPGRGCLTGDTHIMTPNGMKLLKDVNKGDFVYTHTGKLQKVKDTFVYDINNEDMLRIKTNWSYNDIILTNDHEVFGEVSVYTKEYIRRKNNALRLDKCKKWSNFKNSPNWIEAQQLKVGDGLFTPFPKRNIKRCNRIDIAKFMDNTMYKDENFIYKDIPLSNFLSCGQISRVSKLNVSIIKRAKHGGNISHKSKKILEDYLNKFGLLINDWKNKDNFYTKKHDRFINFDNDFAYVLGRWVGDGWKKENNKSNYIGIAFNSNDKIGIERIIKYFNSLGFCCKLNASKTKNLVQLYIYGKTLPRLFSSIIDSYENTSKTKHLPVLFRSMNAKLLQSMIDGLIDSDGHISKVDNRISIDTTSPRLASEVKEALLYLGIPSSILIRDKYMRGKYECAKSYKIRFKPKSTKNIFNNGYFAKILSISKESNINKVYDIHVENDTSYLTTNFAVHNSVGGSLVANLMDIHDLDPIQYGLIFERFHNKEKKAFPDIDTDFSPDGRDWVEQYIIKKYGKANVAHVSNLSRMTPKVVVKDIARSLEIGGGKSEAFKIANKITDSIPDNCNTFGEALKKSENFRKFCIQYPDLEKYGKKLAGIEKAYATHAAGIVIGDIPLSTYVPLRIDKNGSVAVQYEKERCEAVGLIKMDLLGLEHLKILDNTIKNARSLGLKCMSTKEIPLDDPKVWETIAKGKTLCIFQMGSPHMRALCKQIEPKNIEDLSLVNALGRPSAAKSRKAYVACRNGIKKITYQHKCLESVLKETLGVCVYEDQLMKLSNAVAGWDLNKADGLRKLTKYKRKYPELAAELREDFLKGAMEHSKLSRKEALGIWVEIIEPFEGYGFNKPHGIFYSLNGYHTAYYKYYYPAAFMAAVLKSEVEKASSSTRESNIRVYKREAKKMGITIKAPDINVSGQSFTVLDKTTIVTGIAAVKGVGEKAVNNIIEERNKHTFLSFADFLLRTSSSLVRKNVIQPLAKAGCFDNLDITRKNAYNHYSDIRVATNKHYKKISSEGRDAWDVLNDFIMKEKFDCKDEWTLKEKLQGEQETLGEYISGTANDIYNGFFTGKGTTLLSTIKSLSSGHSIRVEAFITDIKQKKTKSGKNTGAMRADCVIQDVNGNSAQLKIWSDQWAKHQKSFGIGKPIRIICKINVWNDATYLVLSRIESSIGVKNEM